MLEKLLDQFSNTSTTTATTYNSPLDVIQSLRLHVLHHLFEQGRSSSSCPLDAIAHRLQVLHQSVELSFQEEEKLCRDRYIRGQEEIDRFCSKSVVMNCIDVLEKIYQEISLGQLPLSFAKPRRVVDETFHLNPMLSESMGLAEIPAFEAKESSHRQFEIRKFHQPRMENEEKTVNKQRYLCVTNGFEIFCLDLKQSKDHTFNNVADVPFISRIATMDLREESLPTIGSLFKWRSNAYMIGGHRPSEPSLGKSLNTKKCYNKFCTHTIKGTSCLTYGLSLSDDVAATAATLSLSESKNHIWKLKEPKAWPIVEEINGQIHVIDSAPARFNRYCSNCIFFHEAFNPDTGTWAETITPNSEHLMYCIKSYLVLGDRIYAASREARLVFDSNEKKWEALSWMNEEMLFFEEVWDILRHERPTRCVGRYPYYGEDPSDPLYVIVALGSDWFPGGGDYYDHYAEVVDGLAFLVTSTGRILCTQRLTHFFKRLVWPFQMTHGTIIQVDDDDEEEKTIMCSIINGHTLGYPYCNRDYLFINTFTVEMLSDAAPRIQQWRRVGLGKAWPISPSDDYIPIEFVRVHTKASYVYRMDVELGLGLDSREWAGMQACFL